MPDTTNYSINDLANIMRVDHKTVRRLIRNGELEAFRVGRIVRITDEAFQAFKRKSAVVPIASITYVRPQQKRRYSATPNYPYVDGCRLAKEVMERIPPLKVRSAIYTKYFTPDATVKDMERTIDRALALYFESQEDEDE